VHRMLSLSERLPRHPGHEENKPRYAGPRFFVRLAELEMHPLDTLDRRNYIREDMGIGLCNITKCCTEVCPRTSTSPTTRSSVERAHRRRHYDPVAWLGRKITGRPVPLAAAEARKHTGAAHAQPAAPATPEPGDIA